MKKIIRYAGSLLLAAGFVACSEWNMPEEKRSKTRRTWKNTFPCWRRKVKPT